MAKSPKEKLEAKLKKAEAAGDAALVKAIKEELVALEKEGASAPAPNGGSLAEPGVVPKEPAEVNVIEERRKAAVAGAKAMGPNPLKRFRVVRVENGHVIVNGDWQIISPLNEMLSEGEATKLAQRFNSMIKPPKDALRKAGSSGTIGEQ